MSTAQYARSAGPRMLPFASPAHGHGPGVCKSCGCESAECRCGCRQCRKEAKEITYTADAKASGDNVAGSLAAAHLAQPAGANAAANPSTVKPATAFVGGGCCVHISLEYAPITATVQSIVAIMVRDTEGTVMLWEKIDPPGTHYQVKENVVTTKPGATILLFAVNATVRARWCEVFSC
ncbi:hypothetical protein [Caulobacter sp. LARHSG274]